MFRRPQSGARTPTGFFGVGDASYDDSSSQVRNNLPQSVCLVTHPLLAIIEVKHNCAIRTWHGETIGEGISHQHQSALVEAAGANLIVPTRVYLLVAYIVTQPSTTLAMKPFVIPWLVASCVVVGCWGGLIADPAPSEVCKCRDAPFSKLEL
ncbi:hypothetical protein H4Q26_010585 [Puccinia striiformis f. sp. tritici PST-130]|nr:hypothetical protein H4Q26_010585 [Puccinia striiformis f. sp. tritici PST-130]